MRFNLKKTLSENSIKSEVTNQIEKLPSNFIGGVTTNKQSPPGVPFKTKKRHISTKSSKDWKTLWQKV